MEQCFGSVTVQDTMDFNKEPIFYFINETLSDTLTDDVRNKMRSQLKISRASCIVKKSDEKSRIWTEIVGPGRFKTVIHSISDILGCRHIVWDNDQTQIIIYLGRDLLCPDKNLEYWIEVRKSELRLKLYQIKKLIGCYPIAVGANHGDKKKEGDWRTPEGLFWVTGIEESQDWVFDFGDGKGPIKGAYGPYFFRLYTGHDVTFSGQSWTGIGIHGTHDPSTIGTLSTHGCIRMHNQDLLYLKKFIKINQPVFIIP